MMTELSLLVKATVVLALALAASRVARRSPASLRAFLLASSLGVLLLLPVTAAILPPRAIAIPVAATPAAFGAEAVPPMFDPVVPPAGGTATHGGSPAFTAPSLSITVRVLWILGALVALIPLAVGFRFLARLRHGSAGWPEGEALAAALARSAGVDRRVRVRRCEQIAAPLTYGLIRPVIVLPIDAAAWSDGALRHALVHELEHIRRHDWMIQLLSRVTCALYWFHPLAWRVWRQWCLESERACDDAVLRGADRAAYADQLIALARRLSNRPAPFLSMAGRSDLTERVGAVLSPDVSRGRVGIVAGALIVCAAAGFTALISPIQAVGPSQDAAAPTGRDTVSIPTAIDGPPFEAASVRPHDPRDRQRISHWHLASGRFTGRNQTLRWFITFAYAPQEPLWLEPGDVTGGPEWIDTERFTIEATAGRSVSTREMQRLVRQVLASRFGLRVHLETRPRNAYRLVLARPDRRLGPELREATESCGAQPARGLGGELGTRTEFTCITMQRLALVLSERVGRPVVDRTGVDGVFDASLTAARTPEELAVIYGLAPSAQPPELFTGVSLFTALPEQLGLRLESARADVDVLVIDRAERPSSNDGLPPPQPKTSSATSPPRQ